MKSLTEGLTLLHLKLVHSIGSRFAILTHQKVPHILRLPAACILHHGDFKNEGRPYQIVELHSTYEPVLCNLSFFTQSVVPAWKRYSQKRFPLH